MYSCTFEKEWVPTDCHFIGVNVWVVLACESLHLCTVCVWHCENARLCVEGFYAPYINFHSFIQLGRGSADRQTDTETYRYAQTEREIILYYTRIKI